MSVIDVLLIYPPYIYPKKSPPIGLGYIASVLEKGGYSVKIIDMAVSGMKHMDLGREVKMIKPKIVGISFMTNQYEEAVNVSAVVKRVNKHIPVIVGGPHVSASPHEILALKTVDIAVMGEGESSVLEVVDNYLKGKGDKLETIKGIAYKAEEKIYVNERREFIQNLDSLPFPAWHLLPLDRYSVPATGGSVAERVFTVISSRGCPNCCIFCDSHAVFGRKFRGRSAKNIFDELVYLEQNFGATQFDFVDDIITIDKNRVFELCALILKYSCKFKWMCNVRVNTVDLEMLEFMKRAGCVRIEFGVESGDTEVLRKLKKGITIEQIETAHGLAREAGLSIGSFVMVGNVGEDFDSVMKTQKLLHRIETDDVYISIATPFPGTELYEMAQNNGLVQVDDWSRYVTAPTYLPGYQPVMRTDKMNTDEILKAFFYLHSRFIKKKFQTRYGKAFFLNGRFYKENILKIRNWKEIGYKVKLAMGLISSYFQ